MAIGGVRPWETVGWRWPPPPRPAMTKCSGGPRRPTGSSRTGLASAVLSTSLPRASFRSNSKLSHLGARKHANTHTHTHTHRASCTQCRGKRNCELCNRQQAADGSRLPHFKKGMHLVTREVVRECEAGLRGVSIGLFTLNCMHTSAGLTVSAAPPAQPRSGHCPPAGARPIVAPGNGPAGPREAVPRSYLCAPSHGCSVS